jgi:exodeoxyribonuclease-5
MEQQIQFFKQAILSQFQHEPTAEQRELIHALSLFTFRTDEFPCFILKGYAGTGKTTVMGAYIQALKSVKRLSVLMAPTGRAAKVLSVKSNKQASTIHRRIYFSGSNQDGVFELNLAPNKVENGIFIVDEASMIADYSLQPDGNVSRNLMTDLLNYVFMGKNNRVIFIGDIAQLPPVGSDESPALNTPYFKQHYPKLEVEDFQLTDVVRQQKESGILHNATLVRNAQLAEKFPKLELKKFNDTLEVTGDELISEIETCYDQYGSDEVMIVTRSNKRATLYNQHIRNRILQMEDELCGGDLLMVVKNSYSWIDPLSPAGFIANGELIRVHRLRRIEELYGIRYAQLEVSLIDYPEMDRFDTLVFMECLTSEQPNLNREFMRNLFFEIEKDFAHIHNKNKRYKEVMQSPYFCALQVKFAYAVTCHKAQGGQWSAVFVDHGFVAPEQQDLAFLRWLYTAITRASEKLMFVQLMEELK